MSREVAGALSRHQNPRRDRLLPWSPGKEGQLVGKSTFRCSLLLDLSSHWLNLLLHVLLGTEVSLLVGCVEVVANCTGE